MDVASNLTARRNSAARAATLFCLIAPSLAFSNQCITPPSGMVGWWPGDDNPTDLVNHNDGIFTGGSYTTGKVGDAFTFSGTGNDYVSIAQNSAFEPQTVTVDAWVRANGSPGTFKYIIAKGGNGCAGGSSYALYTASTGGLAFYVYDGSNFAVSPIYSSAIWDNTWHHVAGSYDGFNVRLYVDGNLVGTTPSSLTINYALNDNTLNLGNYTNCNSSNFAFLGDVDEVEIFNRALTDNEIFSLYAADSAGKCKAEQVTIQVKPNAKNKCFNLSDHNVDLVAIFGSPTFNVKDIDIATLKLNGVEIHGKNCKCQLRDVNKDNIPDYVCKFNNVNFTLLDGATTVTLTGNLKDGTPIIGTDQICVKKKN